MLNLFFSLEGAIKRLKFLYGIVLFDIVLIPLLYLAALNFLLPTADAKHSVVFYLVFTALILYGNFCLIFKRINDAAEMNDWQRLFIKSPWIIYFLFCAYLIIGMITNLIFAQVWPLTLAAGAVLAGVFYLIFYIVILAFLPSRQ